MCTRDVRHAEFNAAGPPPFLAELAVGHQHRRTAQEAAGFGDRHDDLTAGHSNGQGAGGRSGRGQCGDGGRDRSGSAGPGFAYSAFVHPHVRPRPRRCGEDLDVDPVRELARVETHRRGDVQRRQRLGGQRAIDAGQVRVADVDCQAREPPATHDRLARAQQVGLAHVDGDVGGRPIDAVHR